MLAKTLIASEHHPMFFMLSVRKVSMFSKEVFQFSVIPGPPDPPSGKPCIIAGQDCATITWSSSPYDGGKMVTGFAVEYSLVGSDVWTTVTENCHSLSYTVKGLQPGGRYVFRVRALNMHGSSRPSVDSDILQMTENGNLLFLK